MANHEVRLRGRALAERVVSDPTIAPKVSQYADPAFELILKHAHRPAGQEPTRFIVSLEGTDPALTKELLECLLREFKKQTSDENVNTLLATKEYAEANLTKLTASLKDLDERIMTSIAKTRTLGPGGRSILEEQYVNLRQLIVAKTTPPGRNSPADADRPVFPQVRARSRSREPARPSWRSSKSRSASIELILARMLKNIRNPNNDPAVIELVQVARRRARRDRRAERGQTEDALSPTRPR